MVSGVVSRVGRIIRGTLRMVRVSFGQQRAPRSAPINNNCRQLKLQPLLPARNQNLQIQIRISKQMNGLIEMPVSGFFPIRQNENNQS